ncbi:hypothetical protein HY045_02990 [Candidatus Woesebacteria bacterium]|nr:hypothetical protein [Candidatus Woesebacteria bacterium]
MQPTQPVAPTLPDQAQNLVKKLPFKPNVALLVGALVVIVLAGIGSGWLLSGKTAISQNKNAAPGAKVTANEAGIKDDKALPDTAEGVLQEGGISGEGTHHLDRNLGPSKYVYMTSTVIDLQSFVGKKVQVWGETQKAKRAGWLMDVGRVKLIQ